MNHSSIDLPRNFNPTYPDIIQIHNKQTKQLQIQYDQEISILKQKNNFLESELQDAKTRLQQYKSTNDQLIQLIGSNDTHYLKQQIHSNQLIIQKLRQEGNKSTQIQAPNRQSFCCDQSKKKQVQNKLKSKNNIYQKQINNLKNQLLQNKKQLSQKRAIIFQIQRKMEEKLSQQEVEFQNKLIEYEQKLKFQQKQIFSYREIMQNRNEEMMLMKSQFDTVITTLMRKKGKQKLKREEVKKSPLRANISCSNSQILRDQSFRSKRY